MDFDTASQLPLGLRLSLESNEAPREPQVDSFVQESFSRRDAMEVKLHEISEMNRRLAEMVTNLLLNHSGSFDFSSNTNPRENEQAVLWKGKRIDFCKDPWSRAPGSVFGATLLIQAWCNEVQKTDQSWWRHTKVNTITNSLQGMMNSAVVQAPNHLPLDPNLMLQRLLAEQTAASLAKDPDFTAAIAVAISEKMVRQPPT